MGTSKPPPIDDILGHHWADHAAEELLEKHPGKKKFVCASGISPSGMVHIGNFREVVTTELVVRALRDRGKEVHFLYSWDDYDALRKVPAGLPQPEMLEKNLRRPIADIPDPFGTEKSYAAHFEKRFESEITPLGIKPSFIYQNQAYRSCKYAKGIQTALENQKEITAILNVSRTEDLPADWWCVGVYCKTCGKDVTVVKAYKPPTVLEYGCKICKQDASIDFSKEPGVKLLWRVDWPMRWAFEGVDFEPGGKDHSTQGGSYETGAEIIRKVWKTDPPFYVQYDFVIAKGGGAKLSSSKGRIITVGEASEIYEPAVLRWIFASRKPNLDFAIAFDLDVIRTYDDFDRCERYAYGTEPGEEKKVRYEKRIYELSCVEPPKELKTQPAQFGFRHLCNILQIHEGNLAKAKEEYSEGMQSPTDGARFESRAKRAWRWITEYAPDEFKFKVRAVTEPTAKSRLPDAVQGVIDVLSQAGVEKRGEEALSTAIYDVMKANGLDAKGFFPEIYRILINKNAGPKLASFLLAIGPKRGCDLLRAAL